MPGKSSFTGIQYKEYLGEYNDGFTKVLDSLKSVNFPQRIIDKDHTLWSNSSNEISNRLGWLTLPKTQDKEIESINDFSSQILKNGFKSVVILGMGGSSLAPEMFADSFKDINNLNILVLDSTDPEYILSVRDRLDLNSTLIIVSSKSGSTVETISLMNYFLGEFSQIIDRKDIGNHFVSITDPGSRLESISKELGFREIFLNNPDIGGRFSALSYFGLVPGSLTGFNLENFLNISLNSAHLCNTNDININIGLRLGTFMGFLAEKGIDKLTLFTSEQINSLKFWIEQLVAESTGKNGKGILPIPAETLDTNLNYGKDTYVAYIKIEGDENAENEIKSLINSSVPLVVMELDDCYGLAEQIFFWEYATAVAGYFLEVNPFDQPDVESAKIFTRDFVKKYEETGKLENEKPKFIIENINFYSDSQFTDSDELRSWLKENAVEGSYMAIQAFLTPDLSNKKLISDLSAKLASEFEVPVTSGFGPRYLHSSGQLHKGDAGKGIFIQLTSDISKDIPIPDKPFSDASFLSFGVLKNAQALGDYGALKEKGRNIVSINLGSDVNSGLKNLIKMF